jgi:NADH-quinone oxidoreductase subunit M
LAQTELKRLIAHQRRPHGLRVAGIATLNDRPAGRADGNVAHGIITGLLFFPAGDQTDPYRVLVSWHSETAPRLPAYSACGDRVLGLPGSLGSGAAFASS